jgi:hypothetical protein
LFVSFLLFLNKGVFRLISIKQRQINAQQIKNNTLIAKSANAKGIDLKNQNKIIINFKDNLVRLHKKNGKIEKIELKINKLAKASL